MSPQQGTYDHGGGGLFGMATGMLAACMSLLYTKAALSALACCTDPRAIPGARVKVMRHILFGLPQRRQRRTIIEEEESRVRIACKDYLPVLQQSSSMQMQRC